MKILKLLFILFFLYSFSIQAQVGENKWLDKNADVFFNIGKIDKPQNDWPVSSAVLEYLYKTIPVFNDQRSKLTLILQKESPVGFHFDFVQTFEGKEIYGSTLKINISKENNILSLFNKTINTSNWKNQGNFHTADHDLILKLLAFDARIKTIPVFFAENENAFIPAYKVDYFYDNDLKHEELIIDTKYEIIFRHDLNLYAGKKDTIAKGYIFLPDPLTTAKAMYATPYIDYADSAVFELDMQRKLGFIQVSSEDDSMYLESPYVKIVDMADPFTITTFSKTGNFFYSRSEPGFEDVNAYFHINSFQDYVQRLGFTNLAIFQLKVDAHGMIADQSQFIYDNPNDLKLFFGIGGVDDAEDADVIVHEYCHAISHSASNSAFGYERLILEEGLCDYFACSYSKAHNRFGWEKLFNWDGHNPFYEGRMCISDKVYPKALNSGGSPHKFAEIWAGAMMDIQQSLGREKTDRLMLLALFSMSRNMKMSDAAKLVVQADSLLFKGTDVDEIVIKFKKYGLLPLEYHKTGIDEDPAKPTVKILSGYFSENDFVYLKFSQLQNGNIVLYDLQGKELYKNTFKNTSDLNIYIPGLAQGLYILNITTNDIQQSLKLLKK